MRIYFLSCQPAALKLNGIFVGNIDGFERHIRLELSDNVLAEIVPGENLQPVNFFINEKLLFQPPEFMDVYLMAGEALLYVREYGNKNARLQVLYQTRFCGNLVTLFSQGGQFLSVEGEGYELMPLPPHFAQVRAQERTLAGLPVLALRGGKTLLLLSERGKQIFMNEVEREETGDSLKVTVAFETCTAAVADCEYAYDGEKLTLTASRTRETRPPERDVIHFAFFESVLTCGDYARYLSKQLQPRADALKDYLGSFVGVCLPTESFYARQGKIPAAGLIYPKSCNLYEVKYFSVSFSGDKIDNIFPVE